MSRSQITRARRQSRDAPIPLLVDAFGGYFRGSYTGGPSGILNFTSGEGRLTVTGASGATTLTVNATVAGALADYGGQWSCVIRYDDGTYHVHSATNVNTGAGTIDVYPTLGGAVTAQRLGNTYSTAAGQHCTEWGYIGLGYYLGSLRKRDGWMQRAAEGHTYTNGGVKRGADWALAGGLTNGGLVPGGSFSKGLSQPLNLNNFATYGSSAAYSGPDKSYINSFAARSVGISAGTAGHGATHTAALGGKSGYLETYVGVCSQESTTVGSKARVVVTVDGVELYNQLIGGFTRISVPFTNGTTGVLSVALESTLPTAIRVSGTHWWVWGSEWGAVDPAGPIFDAGSRVALLCDSWGVNGNYGLQTGLEAALGMPVIVNASLGGQQATWALANYDTLIGPYQPDFVVMDFLINDQAVGLLTPQEWLTNVRKLTALVLSRGAIPVYMRSLMTASSTQTQILGGFTATLQTLWPAVG